MNNVVFSHKSDDWATPKYIYEQAMKLGCYDPFPFCSEGIEGLFCPWRKINFVNPPYSLVKETVNKAFLEKAQGNYSVLLVPSRTDQKWFSDCVNGGCRIVFIRGRLAFNEKGNAPFPSVLIYFDESPFNVSCVERD